MPNRILREGILTSESVNKLKWGAEVFYRRLMSKVDDYGRYDGRPAILVGEMYALKRDKVSEADVSSWLQECESAGLVSRYEREGKQCVVIHKFDQQVRAKKSKWPDPPENAGTCAQMLADAHLDGGAVGVEDEPPKPPKGAFARDFDVWWETYPHKVGKAAARKAYASARKRTDAKTLTDGVAAYVKHKPSDRPWCNPATWLNQDRWEDEPATGGVSKPVTGIAALSDEQRASLARYAREREDLRGYPDGAQPVMQAMRKHLDAWKRGDAA